MTRIIESVKSMISYRKSVESTRIGFIPTMGALHLGHAELIKKAKKENDLVVVSIFVNPTQFNNKEDFEKYPIRFEDDLKLLEKLQVDVLFLPKAEEIYGDKFRYEVSEKEFSKELCGAHRPGHFSGVLTVVLKLLNLVRPSYAYFGEKDYQQYVLIKDMAHAFFLDTKIVPVPTIRDEDGLALSSRNLRLSPVARKKAPAIYELLKADKPEDDIKRELNDLGMLVDYVESKEGRRYIAATIDNVRLIDNVAW